MLSLRLRFLASNSTIKSASTAASVSPFDGNCLVPQDFKHFLVNEFYSAALKSLRNFSTQLQTVEKKWKIVTAVCLERLPVIAPPMKPIEKQMTELFHEMDVIKSLKSDHEIRQEEDRYVMF